ncbi:MAG TPA: C13 family peptidase [Rudaea sp.]|nr:C13 family peptidase [Rudaea sp.]
MRHQLVQLVRNLRAGARLAFFMPVRRLDFRVGLAEIVMLFVLGAILDFGNDWIRYGPDAYLSLYGGGSEVFSAGLLLLIAAILALLFRQHTLLTALPVMVLSALPFIQSVHAIEDVANRWLPKLARDIGNVESVFTAWIVIVLIRCVATALTDSRPRRMARSVVGGLLLATPLWIASAFMPNEPWWQQPALTGGVDPRYPNPASEAVLSAQADLLDSTLEELDDERPDTTDLYFVAFGGYASEDVFRKDVETAQRIMDDRWDTKDRSVVLINNPRTLLERPMATVTNLRETLKEIAGAIDADEDVVMIYLASHGAPGQLAVRMPPLDLEQLTPDVLRKLLDDAGITWRIIVVSSCYSGSFIPALQDEHTLVITASQADRTSFGCGFRSDATYFGEAFFEQGLAKSESFPEAFERAKQRIAQREREEGYSPPSNPQIFVGAAMAEKLKELERGGAARRAGKMVCSDCSNLTRVRGAQHNLRRAFSS